MNQYSALEELLERLKTNGTRTIVETYDMDKLTNDHVESGGLKLIELYRSFSEKGLEMGYRIYLMDASVHIGKEKFSSALEAVKGAFSKNGEIQSYTQLGDAMEEFGYAPEFDGSGDIYVLTSEMLDSMIEKEHPDGIEPGDTYEMAEYMGLEYIGDFTGEAIRLDENGCDDYRNGIISYSCDPVFCFPTGSYSTLFQAAYQSKEELARCMKARYPGWLPDVPDEICDGIRHIVGTSFG